MRGHELQELLIASVDGLTVDDKTSVSDRFRHDPGQSDPSLPRIDRTWQLVQGQVEPFGTFEARTFTAYFEGLFYYVDGPELARRIMSDGERILCFLPTIGAAMHPHIMGCGEIGPWIPSQDEVSGQIVCRVTWAVTYFLTGV